jgi:hypothetical protein
MFPSIVAAMLYLSLIWMCGRFRANYAAERGRSKAEWFIGGGLLYPVPYIALALLPPVRNETAV